MGSRGRRSARAVAAALVLWSGLPCGEGADQVWPDPDYPVGRPATHSEARIYWTGSIVATTASLIVLLRLLRNYLREPDYQDATVRVFIPALLGNALFTVCFGAHHVANVIYDIDPADLSHGGLKGMGFWCDLSWPGVAGYVVQAVGLTVVAWAPLHLIRCGKEFQPMRVSKRHLACATLLGFLVAFAFLLFFALSGGRAQYRGLYCSPHFWGTPNYFLPILSAVVVFVCITAALYRKANSEVDRLGHLAHACSLREEAAAVRWHGFLTIANYFFWSAPLAVALALEVFGAVRSVPIPVMMWCNWSIKCNALGYLLILRARTRHMSSRAAPRRASLATTFHKGEKVDLDTSQLLNRAVSIHFLQAFTDHHMLDVQMPIQTVMEHIIMPATDAAKCPYVETVLDLWDEADRPAVGTAKYFVSHCWADSSVILVDQLSNFYWRLGVEETVYFWVDIFAINQHNVSAASELPLMHTVISGVDALVLTLNPWHAPLTLTRVWCLWELLKAAQSETTVCPVMPPEEEEDFVLTVRQQRGRIADVLSTIDVHNATATVESDRQAIFHEIADTVGFEGLNASVRGCLRVALQGIAVERAIRGIQRPSERGAAAGVASLPIAEPRASVNLLGDSKEDESN